MSTTPPDDDDRTVIQPRKEREAATPEPAAGDTAARPAAASPVVGPVVGPVVERIDEGNGTLPSGTYLGEFELTSLLGEGGFGIVYLAWDHSLQRKVALKEYMPSSLAMRVGASQVQVKSARHRDTFEAGLKSFVNEARLLAQFDHPSLVKVYRFWEANGTAYMVMPFYEGITLKDRLKQMGQAPDEAWLMNLLAPLTEALEVIHAERCYHRDIAPDNVILLGSSGRPLLLDFGAARRVIGDMTQALTVILKPGYAPVEQYAEAPGMKQGPWTDIYALAASIYFALLGKTPPPSVSRLMGDAYVPLAESCAGRYSERFLRAIDKALRVRPEERTASIAELRADLGLAALSLPSQETRLISDPAGRGNTKPAPTAASAETSTTPAAPLAGWAAAPASAAISAPTSAPTSAPASDAEAKSSSRRTLWTGAAATALLLGAAGAYLSTRSPDAPLAGQPAAPPASVPPLAASHPSTSDPDAATTQVPAALSFDVQQEFERVLSQQTAGFSVEAKPNRPQLRVDKDNLGLSLTSSRDGYVTVLVLGPDGSLIRLIPSAEMRDIRIKAGVPLKLPPPQVVVGTSEPLGTEHFLVMVSTHARDYSALSTQQEGGYLMLPTGLQAAEKLAKAGAANGTASGAPGLPALLGAAKACNAGDCNEYGAARFNVEVTR